MTTWVTPTAWVAGVTPGSAANLQKLSDDLNVLGEAAQSYTPVLTASVTNPTMGSSIITGRYRLLGKWLDLTITLTIGAGFAGGSGFWSLSFPSGLTPVVTAQANPLGIASARDVSVPADFLLMAKYTASTTFALTRTDTLANVGTASPMTWATGDLLNVNIRGLETA